MKSLLFFMLLLAGGVVGYFYWQQSKYPVSIEEPKTEAIRKGSIEEKITGSGKLELKGGLYYVISEKEGKIDKVTPGLAIGKYVKKGDVLITLDSSLAQNRVSEAEAAVSTAQADVARAEANKVEKIAQIKAIEKELEFVRAKLQRAEQSKDSIGGGIISEARKELEKAEASAQASYALRDVAEASITLALANKQRAEAGLTLARRGLEQTTIKSPCDGVILEINKLVKDSQPITAGPVNNAPLFIIAPSLNANLDDWEVKAQISEQDIGKLQTKLKANPEQAAIPVIFTVEAYSLEKIKFTGKVTRIDPLPALGQRGGMGGLEALMALGGGANSSGPALYNVIISVDKMDDTSRAKHPLFVGYTASDLQIIIEKFNDIITVPSAALSFTPDSLSDAQQKELRKNEEEGWSPVWFYAHGSYSARYIKAGASELGRTHVKEVLQGKPEDLLGKTAVIEAPKKAETGGLFGNAKFRMPG
ncbi:MAG: biotin/lipoyl-binding protein [Gemmatales bacterium]